MPTAGDAESARPAASASSDVRSRAWSSEERSQVQDPTYRRTLGRRDVTGDVRQRGGKDGAGSCVAVLATIRSRSVIDRIAASYAPTVAPAIARGTRRAAVSLLIIGIPDNDQT